MVNVIPAAPIKAFPVVIAGSTGATGIDGANGNWRAGTNRIHRPSWCRHQYWSDGTVWTSGAAGGSDRTDRSKRADWACGSVGGDRSKWGWTDWTNWLGHGRSDWSNRSNGANGTIWDRAYWSYRRCRYGWVNWSNGGGGAGSSGPTGPTGNTGSQGTVGTPGTPGGAGATGPTGATGAVSTAPGPTGPTGGGGAGGGGFTASSTAPVAPTAGDHWYDLSTGVLSIYVNDGTSSQWVMVSPGGGGTATPGPPQGRLSLTINTPVMTASAANQTVIYYIAHVGSMVPFYDGTTWTMRAISSDQISVSTTDTTQNPAAIGASKVNDWFIWWNGSLTKLSHGPDWTNDTTRSAGTALVRVNGIWLNNAAITNGPAAQRGTYVGTTRSNASSQLDWIYGTAAASGGAAFFGVWNCYNRVDVRTTIKDTTSTWVPPTGTVRQFNNSSGNRASAVFGLSEDGVDAMIQSPTNTNGNSAVGIGLNSTTAFHADGIEVTSNTTGSAWSPAFGRLVGVAPLGFNFWQALEYAAATSSLAGVYAAIAARSGMTFSTRM